MQGPPQPNISDTGTDNNTPLTERQKANIRAKLWFQENRERRKEYITEWNAQNVHKNRSYQQKYRIKLKKLAINHYSDGLNNCACCQEPHMEFLTIDHLDGNGGEHRKILNVRGGHSFYGWLKTNDFPEGYQVLCINCNLSLGSWGYCPHKAPSVF